MLMFNKPPRSLPPNPTIVIGLIGLTFWAGCLALKGFIMGVKVGFRDL